MSLAGRETQYGCSVFSCSAQSLVISSLSQVSVSKGSLPPFHVAFCSSAPGLLSPVEPGEELGLPQP